MDIKTLNKMVREIEKRLKEKQGFMEAKRAILNIYGFQGEERTQYSSLLSKHFGTKGGKASAASKKRTKEAAAIKEKERQQLLQEATTAWAVSDAEDLQHQEAVRAGAEEE